MRAFAVVLVVLFHLWPGSLPGGFVGVDVFFVISGYLITGLLLREAEKTGSVSLSAFYARRVRRLLPAATLVLFVVALATPLLPRPVWQATAREIAASAVYAENWLLASLAVDYLGAENAASPVQHYWSLSIEEQFYIVWPVLILGACAFALWRRRNLRVVLFYALSAAAAGSLAASIMLTLDEPEAAYFLTHTRIWELALGGLLALVALPLLSARTAELLRIAGLAAIAAAAFTFSERTQFPGYAALLPTLGAALVIAAGDPRPRWSVWPALAMRPSQYLGDISYSVYLWHWPLIVFYLVLADRITITPLAGLLLVALIIALSHITKRQVEDRFRYGASESTSSIKVVTFGTAAVAGCIVAAGAIHFLLSAPYSAAAFSPRSYPGAMVMVANIAVPDVDAFHPPLETIKRDLPDVYNNGCHVSQRDIEPRPCEYGVANADFHVVIAGDSHAGQWIPALQLVAAERGWRLTTHTKSSCALLTKPLRWKDRGGRFYEPCVQWGARVMDWLRTEKPDLVLVTQTRGHSLYGITRDQNHAGLMAEAIADTWTQVSAMNIGVVTIADTPRMPFDPPECVSRSPKCAAGREDAFELEDPILAAHAKKAGGVGLLDMNDLICREDHCPAVIGNVIVWRDQHHLTASYVKTLAPVLGERIDALIRKPADSRSANRSE